MGRYTYFFATFAILPVIVIAGVIALFTLGKKEPGPTDAAGVEKDMQLYLEIRQKLLDHYDGELEENDLRDAALVGLAQGTGDRFTRVLPPVQARAQDQDLGGGFYGIGAYIDPNDDGSIRITGLQPDGGAEKAGILIDDIIVAVDGISIIDQTFESSVARIKSNEENSVVKLTIHRGGSKTSGTDESAMTFEFEVVRSRVITYSVHDVHIEERDGHSYGYVQISDINANTFDPQFKDAIAELAAKGAEGFVVDLRGNGGGRVNAAVDLADGLIKEPDQTIVFTHSSRESNRGSDHVYKTKDALSITDLPVILLIDGGTASAAEIITGALKDTGRAFVIGERSYGKGIVQTIYKLQTDPNYTVNITTTQYFTPLGLKVQNPRHSAFFGVPPDQLAGELRRWGLEHDNADAYELAGRILTSDVGGEGGGGIQPDLEIRYRAGERDRVRWRMRIRQARNNRDEIAKSSSWWNQEDRMLDAALDVLNGKPVTVGP
ncbi:MAG: PDZ domain-containing protein [Planctomycetes bacterium]|nr:PDZ domain-containing protein [Planctomycetota bacterium]